MVSKVETKGFVYLTRRRKPYELKTVSRKRKFFNCKISEFHGSLLIDKGDYQPIIEVLESETEEIIKTRNYV